MIALTAVMAVPALAAPLSYDVIRTSDRSLDTLIALDPLIVVPGHEAQGLPHDQSALRFTRDYLDQWPILAARAKDAKDLIRLVKRAFPLAQDPNGDFSLITSARVTMGEEPKWDE